MNIETAKRIRYMIEKELGRWSLDELCEEWEISVDDFDEFLECAIRYAYMAES